MSGPPPDYVDVAQRIQDFYAFYPDGRLTSDTPPQLFHVGEKTFMAYCAKAYRMPDDPFPGVGWAWEPVPGPTPFTRDSELQNAETSAWGRAIVALGFETKHIASANEVRNRSGEKPDFVAPEPASKKAPTKGQMDTLKLQLKLLDEAFPEHPGDGRTWANVAQEHAGKPSKDMSMAEMNSLLEWLEDQFREAAQAEAVPFG